MPEFIMGTLFEVILIVVLLLIAFVLASISDTLRNKLK